jgi:methionyl-tRNA synthetase
LTPEEGFRQKLDLRVAKILKVERHPKAEKLYVETLDDGSGAERVIVSGLVPFYKEEELLGKSVILAYNLKAAKLRGIESRGMLLAASAKDAEGLETVEVLEAAWAPPGTRLVLEGDAASDAAMGEIDIDAFFAVPLRTLEGELRAGEKRILAAGNGIGTLRVRNGSVG